MSSPAQAVPTRSDPKYVARDYAELLDGLKEDFVDRDEAIEVIALATLCREHVLLVGPPGTAKTALLTRFAQLFDTTAFTYLLTRFTEPTELFGPVDVEQFKQGLFRVRTENMLPHAHLAFLDEVFEGSSAILNSLLTLINERTFYNGSTHEPSELITLLGSSNQIPDDPVLAAFGDRFLLRCDLFYVDDMNIGAVLERGWDAEQKLIRQAGTAPGARGSAVVPPPDDGRRFALSDLATLQDAVASTDLSPVHAIYTEILRDLRGQRVTFSDRRAVKAQKVLAASAVLDGRRAAEPADLRVLTHLWTDRRDQDTIRRSLEAHDVELSVRAGQVRELGLISLTLRELVNQREQARTRQDLWEIAERLQALKRELRQDHPSAATELQAVEKERHATVAMIQERSAQEDGDV